jgi:predicted ester cyclase
MSIQTFERRFTWLWPVFALAGCGSNASQPAARAALPDADAAAPAVDGAAQGADAGETTTTAARYAACLHAYDTQDWTVLATCYAANVVQEEPDTGSPPWKGVAAAVGHLQLFAKSFPDSTIQPQLTLVSGRHVVGMNLLRGTNTGPLPGNPTPTGKPIGYLFAHPLELDDAGLITSEWIVYDHATLFGQLGLGAPPARPLTTTGASDRPVVVATGSATEAANLAAYQKAIAAWSAHDKTAFAAGLADGVVWSERSLSEDLDRSALLTRTTQMWSGFSDLKRTPNAPWPPGTTSSVRGR